MSPISLGEMPKEPERLVARIIAGHEEDSILHKQYINSWTAVKGQNCQ
jgi:hypothetical protein